MINMPKPNMIPDIRPEVWKIALEVAKESEKYCANPVNPESEQFQFIVHELSGRLLASVMAEVVDEVQYLVDWRTAEAVEERVDGYLESK